MAENKTKQTDASVSRFLNTVKDVHKREDSVALVEIMSKITKMEPKMWGPSIVGFGSHHYKYDSGREGDICIVGFSPRKEALTLYLMGGIQIHEGLLKSLGKYKTGKGCLYIKELADVDLGVLKKLISASFKDRKAIAAKLSAKK
jgi:hypothetical protein